MEEAPKLKPCPVCHYDKPDPHFWAVGPAIGPGCYRCGATARNIEEWNRGETTEGHED